jgi:acyl transferase domain-containing protein
VPALGNVAFEAPAVPIISNATGAWADADGIRRAECWIEAPQRPALEKGVRTLLDSGYDVFVNAGPASMLTDIISSISDSLRVATFSALTEHGQYAGGGGLYRTAARLWEAGADVDWEKLYEGERRIKTPLPTYPFERKDYGADIAAYHLSGAGLPDKSEAPRDVHPSADTSADIETVVVDLLKELSGQKSVDTQMALADLGSDSLSALKLIQSWIVP